MFILLNNLTYCFSSNLSDMSLTGNIKIKFTHNHFNVFLTNGKHMIDAYTH